MIEKKCKVQVESGSENRKSICDGYKRVLGEITLYLIARPHQNDVGLANGISRVCTQIWLTQWNTHKLCETIPQAKYD